MLYSLPLDIKRRIGSVIGALQQTPRPANGRKLEEHQSLYRVRVGQYRVVYEIDDKARLIRVTRVRHKREVYR
ncbi:MAG: type II toxin-antitoxin system RelE/ParE family toxin [Thermodesulfobacteriota bacterium]